MEIKDHLLYQAPNKKVPFKQAKNFSGEILKHKYIIIHYTEGATITGAVGTLTQKARPAKKGSAVSAHMVIGRDGALFQLLSFNVIAWHAGSSHWGEDTDLNRFSIGLELDNAGRMSIDNNHRWKAAFGRIYPPNQVIRAAHKFGIRKYGWHIFPQAQIDATVVVCKAITAMYGPMEILGHDDITPKRKWDPGPAFPMDEVRTAVAGK